MQLYRATADKGRIFEVSLTAVVGHDLSVLRPVELENIAAPEGVVHNGGSTRGHGVASRHRRRPRDVIVLHNPLSRAIAVEGLTMSNVQLIANEKAIA